MSGLESGGINLQSVRVDEGKRIAKLHGHTSAVSALNLAQDERSVLSGGWDKTVIDWDLDTGQIIRKFEGSGGQISALETRPLSSLKVPEASGDIVEVKSTFSTNDEAKPRIDGSFANGVELESKLEPLFGEQAINGDAGSPADSLFGGNDGDSLFGDNDNENGAPSGGPFVPDDDDDFSRAIANGLREQAEEPDHEQTKVFTDTEGDVHMDRSDNQAVALPSASRESEANVVPKIEHVDEESTSQRPPSSSVALTNGLPHTDGSLRNGEADGNIVSEPGIVPPISESTFLAAAFDGSLRIWDKRQSVPIAKITPQNVPPWCMSATWSPDGNFIYAGRRNGTVDEYSLHKGLRSPARNFKLPNNSGPVSALRPMPNGRHLIW